MPGAEENMENAHQPAVDPPAAEKVEDKASSPKKVAAATTPKVKKAKVQESKAKRPRNVKAAAAHPTYYEMICDAIGALKERTGSSLQAIAKFSEEKHKSHLPPNFRKVLLTQVKKLVSVGKLTKVKGSYKLPVGKPKPAAAGKAAEKAKKVGKPKAAKPKTASKSTKVTKVASSKRKAPTAPAKPKVAASKVKQAAGKPKVVIKPKVTVKPKVAVKPKKSSGRPAKVAKTHAKATPGKVPPPKPAGKKTVVQKPKSVKSAKRTAKATKA